MRSDVRLQKQGRYAFTLIELLIVVAIIAILAAIAVPNFLEAQTRSKVTRVKADMRSLSTAAEAYRIDHNAYPITDGYIGTTFDGYGHGGIHMAHCMTTPVAYITSVDITDPFAAHLARNSETGFIDGMRPYSISYCNIKVTNQLAGRPVPGTVGYVFVSLGPDFLKGPDPTGRVADWHIQHYSVDPLGNNFYALWEYDPTNGTKSGGDILRWP